MNLRVAAVLLICALASRAQSTEHASPASDPDVPTIALELASTTKLSTVNEPFLSDSLCSSDQKTLVTRVASSGGPGDIISVSLSDKSVVRYNTSQIGDVHEPVMTRFFVADSGVYILTNGTVPTGKTLKLKTPSGQTVVQQADASRDYVAYFRLDGAFVRVIPLDIPFTALQIGVFPSGDFLVAGVKQGTDEPVMALVNQPAS